MRRRCLLDIHFGVERDPAGSSSQNPQPAAVLVVLGVVSEQRGPPQKSVLGVAVGRLGEFLAQHPPADAVDDQMADHHDQALPRCRTKQSGCQHPALARVDAPG